MGKLGNKWCLFWFNLIIGKKNPGYEQMFFLGPVYIYITVQCWTDMYLEPEYNIKYTYEYFIVDIYSNSCTRWVTSIPERIPGSFKT